MGTCTLPWHFSTTLNYLLIIYNRTWYQTTIPLFYRPYPCGQPLIDFLQWGGPFTEPLTTVRVVVLWWRRQSFGHMRLGVNFMSWSNFCVLVWLFLPWRDFITLSDIIRICGHVMSDVITLWWSRESWYDFFYPSWMKFSSWWDFVCLGVILHLGVINRILVWFSFVLDTIFVLVRFYLFWLDILVWLTASWYDFFHFVKLFRLSVILLDMG